MQAPNLQSLTASHPYCLHTPPEAEPHIERVDPITQQVIRGDKGGGDCGVIGGRAR